MYNERAELVTSTHSQALAHCGTICKFATHEWVCQNCGSGKLGRTSGANTICKICGSDLPPMLASAFINLQNLELNK
jgi:NADH pyrophosphatase NudC (nudix superfamily)